MKPPDATGRPAIAPYQRADRTGKRLLKRLCAFTPEYRGDWFDVDAVDRAVNFALESAGRKERFISLFTGGQTAAFAFADPDAFRPIAAKFRLPLSNDETPKTKLT